jgi:hypothetical protein
MNKNLTATQNDYAYFLPATSGFYSTYIGKQRYSNYVDPARIPASLGPMGIEAMNYLDPNAAFYYDHCLYSAGHANLDLNKQDDGEDMFRNRNRKTSWVLGDSGGFQIGKGKWEGNWKDPNCPKAQKKREAVLKWMDALMDYGMCLDVPAWVARSPAGAKATGISTYAEAVQATFINNDYFINNRNGNCKFLNVLQGENHTDAEGWYQHMKKYCDPKQYPGRHFNGWGMGGQNMCDVHLTLKRLVALRFDGLLEKGEQDWMHFLGTSKLEWALLLTDIQRAVRKYHNDQFTISFDCASPFLATANGQIYVQTEIEDREKWLYRMLPSVDDKKYANDTRLFQDAVVQDKWFSNFETSPIMDGIQIKDICIYGPNDVNKLGKIGKTSWDSFTYALMMGHNVWMHINSVQEANRQYDAGKIPAMLSVADANTKVVKQYDHMFFKDIVNAIFETSDRGRADALVDEYDAYWKDIPGTRGYIGKNTVNANTKAEEHLDIEANFDLLKEFQPKSEPTKPVLNDLLFEF